MIIKTEWDWIIRAYVNRLFLQIESKQDLLIIKNFPKSKLYSKIEQEP